MKDYINYRNVQSLLVLSFLFVCCVCSSVFGQNPDPIDSYLPYSSDAQYKKVGSPLGSGKYENNEEKTAFANHFYKFVLTRWTISVNVPSIPEFRDELIRDLKRAKDGGEPHADAVRIIYGFCYNVIANPKCAKYSPAVKYNAMLLMGDLREKEVDGKTPATVYGPALDFTLKCVNNAKVPEYIQLGAAKSLNSFLDASLSNEQKQKISAYLFEQLQTKVDKDSTPGAIWKKELAIVGLGKLGNPGAKGEVVLAVGKVVNDSSAPMSTRIIAANSLGSYSFVGQTMSPAAFRRILCKLIADAFEEELERPTEALRWQGEQRMSRRQTTANDLYMDDSMSDNQDYKDSVYLRQRIFAPLVAVNTALRGIAANKGQGGIGDLGSDEEKELTTALERKVDSLLRDLKEEKIDIETVQDMLKGNMASFRKMAQGK